MQAGYGELRRHKSEGLCTELRGKAVRVVGDAPPQVIHRHRGRTALTHQESLLTCPQTAVENVPLFFFINTHAYTDTLLFCLLTVCYIKCPPVARFLSHGYFLMTQQSGRIYETRINLF